MTTYNKIEQNFFRNLEILPYFGCVLAYFAVVIFERSGGSFLSKNNIDIPWIFLVLNSLVETMNILQNYVQLTPLTCLSEKIIYATMYQSI